MFLYYWKNYFPVTCGLLSAFVFFKILRQTVIVREHMSGEEREKQAPEPKADV